MTASTSPRERITKTALNLFYIHGYGAVGTNQICAEASVNKSTLYHLFPSKIDIMLVVLDLYAEDIASKFKHIAQSKKPSEAKLDLIFKTPFQTNKELKDKFGNVPGCFVGNIALELAAREERVRVHIASVLETWAKAIEPIVREMITDPNSNVEEVAYSIVAYLQGAILLAKTENNPERIVSHAKSAAMLIP